MSFSVIIVYAETLAWNAHSKNFEFVRGKPAAGDRLPIDHLNFCCVGYKGAKPRQFRTLFFNRINYSFFQIVIESKVTQRAAALMGEKGNADERKRRAELEVLTERTVSLANKTIIKGLQSCIDRADKVYEGVKKVMDFRARESWFDSSIRWRIGH